MVVSFYAVLLFGISAIILYLAGELLVSGLLRLARHFKVTEFVVAFFVMAFAATLPNLFVGITSALQGIPELSFGDIMGNNVVALTLAAALGIFFSPKRELPLENQTIQDTTFLTAIAAILPIILISDGVLSRSDGLVLILFFVGYVYWLFSKRERFSKVYAEHSKRPPLPPGRAMREVFRVILGVALLATAAQGIVHSATLLAEGWGMPLVLIGVLVLGLGGALPELYFTVISARRGETGMIIGSLMGAVIIPVTLVLGIVAMIEPIYNEDLEFPILARAFLVVVALYFLYASQTKDAISKREGWLLIGVYLLFVASFLFVW